METSNAAEVQWEGQDKRDTVACEVVHWVKVAKGKGSGEKGGES
jgi:hypothetical protein